MSKASVKSLYLHFLDEFLGTDERFSQTLEANALALINEFDVGKARIESAESSVREFATKFGIERLDFTPADPIGAMVEAWNNQADALNAIWSEGVCDMERMGPSLLPNNWSASLEQQENQSQIMLRMMVALSADFPSRWQDKLRTCSSALAAWGIEDLVEAHRHALGELTTLEKDWQQLRERSGLTLIELHNFWSATTHKKLEQAIKKAEQECENLCEKARLLRERKDQEHKELERLELERLKHEREEQDRKERENLERVRNLKERLEQERNELERLEHERLNHERLKLEREEQERKERDKLERHRNLKERLEQERKELERLERERLKLERDEKERKELKKIERERKLKERLEQERKELERLERERLKLEREEQERIELIKKRQAKKIIGVVFGFIIAAFVYFLALSDVRSGINAVQASEPNRGALGLETVELLKKLS
jgi:hypothetical protein